jgi:hypothetical protein
MRQQPPRVGTGRSDFSPGTAHPTRLHRDATAGIIGAFYRVHGVLGYGSLEIASSS